LSIVSGGTIYLQSEDPNGLRKSFVYAQACGMPMIVAGPTHKTLPAVEALAKEFDIRVAVFQGMRYTGCVNLEYEINSDNPVPGMLHSIGYMRGVLAGLAV
jgi:hypothetical protein